MQARGSLPPCTHGAVEHLHCTPVSTHRLQAGDPSTNDSAANCQGRSQVTQQREVLLFLNDLQLISSNVPLEWQHLSMTFRFPVAPRTYDLHLPAELIWKCLRALSHSSALAEGSKPRTGTHRITTQGAGAAGWCCCRQPSDSGHTQLWVPSL